MFTAEPTVEDNLPIHCETASDVVSAMLADALLRLAKGPREVEYPCDEQDFGGLVALGLAYQSGTQWGLTAKGRTALGLRPAKSVPRRAIRRGRFDLGTIRIPALSA